MIEKTKLSRSLPCRISEHEALEAMTLLAQQTEEAERLILSLRIAAKQTNDDRKRLRKSMAELAKKVNSREELRLIECEVTRDFKRGEIIVVRTDTGEEIERLPMNRDQQRTIEGTE